MQTQKDTETTTVSIYPGNNTTEMFSETSMISPKPDSPSSGAVSSLFEDSMKEIGSLFTFNSSIIPTTATTGIKHSQKRPRDLVCKPSQTKKHKHSAEPSSMFNVRTRHLRTTSEDSSSESFNSYNPQLKIRSLFPSNNIKPLKTSNGIYDDYKTQYQYLKDLTDDKINYYLNFDFDHSDNENVEIMGQIPRSLELSIPPC
ncbi:hypothetical protein WICPIJ_007544 [Wickerhamomyces pijperi]|uniref:Uncharacterized protein n=1 Tax=Wickerhamomyces pijperi TaxID=599730 RepID=A0A9P8Q1I4_WICPI|nr:hypothetical protein WICPIJ_007544 [Wickerhamomyces pijperi]